MSASAFLKNYRVSPRKARLVADQIRGKVSRRRS
jgi:ribosomal protein L22